VGYAHSMRICTPDTRGRVNLGNLVSPGDTWAVSTASADRIELVRMQPAAKKRRRSFLEHMDRIRSHGLQLPERDQSAVRIPEL
jgi:hypothetical protein